MNIQIMKALTASVTYLKNAFTATVTHPIETTQKVASVTAQFSSTIFQSMAKGTLTSVKVSTSFFNKSTISCQVYMASATQKNDPDFMLPKVKEYPHLIKYASATLQSSPQFMAPLLQDHPELIEDHPDWIQFVSKDLLNNPDFMLPKVQKHPHLIKYASADLKDSPLFMAPLLQDHPELIEFASKDLSEGSLMVNCTKQDPTLIRFAGATLKNNKQIMEPLIRKVPKLIEFASSTLTDSQDLMQFVVQKDPALVIHASSRLRDNLKFMRFVIQLQPSLVTESSETLRKNPEFMQQVIELDHTLIKHADKTLTGDKDFMIEAVKKNNELLLSASKKLKNDITFMTSVIKLNPSLVEQASDILKGNPEFMTSVITLDPTLSKHASQSLTASSEFKEALRYAELDKATLQNLTLVQHAREEFKDNRILMGRAVSQNPELYQYASERLKNDPQFIQLILKSQPHIVDQIEDHFKNDKELMKIVVQKNPSLIKFVGDKLRNDPEFMEPIIRQHPEALEFAFPELKALIKSEPQSLSYITTTTSSTNPNVIANNIAFGRKALFTENSQSKYLNKFADIYRFVKFIETEASKNTELLKYTEPTLLKNPALMISISCNNSSAIQHLHPELLADVKTMSDTILLLSTEAILSLLPLLPPKTLEEMYKQKSFVTQLAEHNIIYLKQADKSLLNDPAFMIPFILKNHLSLQYAEPPALAEINKKREVITQIAEKDISYLRNADQSLLNDPAFMLPIILKNIQALQYAGDKVLKNSPTMCKIALEHPKEVMDLKKLPAEMKDDPEFMKAVMKTFPEAFNQIGPKLQLQLKTEEEKKFKGKKWIDNCLEANSGIFKAATPEFLQKLALEDYHILQHVPLRLRNESRFMEPIISKHRQGLKYIGSDLQDDKNFFDKLAKTHGAYSDNYASDIVKRKFSILRTIGLKIKKPGEPERRAKNED